MTITQPGSGDRNKGSQGIGFAMGIGLNLLEAGLAFAFSKVFEGLYKQEIFLTIAWGAAGLIQLSYIVPLYIYLRRKGKPETAKGLTAAAAVIIFINVACWGLVTIGYY